MPEEREISINVRASQAIRSLTLMATRLDEMGTLVGKTDGQLRVAERQLEVYSERVTTAAKVITQLRAAQTDLAYELKLANKQLLNQGNLLAETSGKLQGARSVIGSYRTELSLANKTIAAQTTEINRLTEALERYAVAQNTAARSKKIRTDRAAGSALVASNLSYIPANTIDKTPIGSSFGTIERDAKGAEGAISNLRLTTQTLRNTMISASYSLGIFGAVLILLEALPARVATNFNAEFAQVKRTVSGAGEDIKTALIQLSEQIPVTFKDLAGIATLGGQLGLGASQIIDFTKVVAELTATTDLSADAAGTLIGRMASFYNLPSDEFEKLASAILRTGVTSVATESQIAALATRLSGAGSTLHLSAQEVIGFAAALASVNVRPYAATGTFNRFAGVIRNAVASGGSELETLAKIAGTTSDKFAAAFNSGKWDATFTSLIEGFTDTSKTGGDAVNVLRELGLTGVTDAQTFRQLAAAPKAVAKAFAESNDAFAKGTEIQRQYAIRTDTTAGKVKLLENSFTALMNTLGQSGTNLVGAIAPGIANILKSMTELNSNPVSGAILGGGGIVAAITGVIAVLSALGLRGYAGILGLTDTLRGLNAESKITGGALGALQVELAATGRAGAFAAGGIRVLAFAMKSLVIGLAVFTGLQLLGQLAQLGDTAKLSAVGVTDLADSTKNIKKYVDQASGSFKKGFDLQGLDNIQYLATLVTGINGHFSEGGFKSINDFFGGLPGLGSGLQPAREAINNIDQALANLVKNGNASKAAKEMQFLINEAVTGGVDGAEFQQQFHRYNAAVKAFQVQQTRAATSVIAANKEIETGTVDVIKTLRDLLGLSAKSKFIGQFEKSFADAVKPLTDFNSVVGQVQQHIEDVQAAQKQGVPLAKYIADQNRDVAVSLKQVTDQLNTNNGAQKKWQSNLTQLSSQIANDPAFGPQVATSIVGTMLSAGYSVTNASFLAQLVKATPKQRDAWIDAQEEAVTLAGQSAADTLLSTGYLVTATGAPIGKKMADGIATALASGLDVQGIMALFNLKFTANPLEPQVNTVNAETQLENFREHQAGMPATIPVRVNTAQASADLAAFLLKLHNASIKTGLTPYALYGAGQFPGGYTGGLVSKGKILPRYADGAGLIRGPGTGTSDSILARVSNGEGILNARAVQYYGENRVNDMNRLRFPRFADGGVVGHYPNQLGNYGPQFNIHIELNNPVTRDPIKDLKQNAQDVVAGIWS